MMIESCFNQFPGNLLSFADWSSSRTDCKWTWREAQVENRIKSFSHTRSTT